MTAKTFCDISEAAQSLTGLSRTVLDWALTQKRLMDASKSADFDPSEWDQLSSYVDLESFKRIGNFKEEMNFCGFLDMMRKWAPFAHWEGSFKRITEHDNVVILELEERVLADGLTNAVNSVSIYEFNDAGKLQHLDVYLQTASAPALVD
ncbi:MAG: hypothetical protein ACKOWI_04435 [Rhodoluna sp.]